MGVVGREKVGTHLLFVIHNYWIIVKLTNRLAKTKEEEFSLSMLLSFATVRQI